MKFNFLLFLLIPIISNCQIINIDKVDTMPYKKSADYSGKIAFGIEIDKQTTDIYQFDNSADISLRKYKTLYILSLNERLTQSGNSPLLNTGYVHLRMRNNYKNRIHLESFIQYQWNDNLGMEYRYLTGENIRQNLWYKKKWEMSIGSGIMFESEKWNYTASKQNLPSIITTFIKNNTFIKWEGEVSESTSLCYSLFYQAKFEDFFNPRIFSTLDFSIGVSKRMCIQLNYSAMHDSKPIVPVPDFFYSFRNKLIYKL